MKANILAYLSLVFVGSFILLGGIIYYSTWAGQPSMVAASAGFFLAGGILCAAGIIALFVTHAKENKKKDKGE